MYIYSCVRARVKRQVALAFVRSLCLARFAGTEGSANDDGTVSSASSSAMRGEFDEEEEAGATGEAVGEDALFWDVELTMPRREYVRAV